VAISYRLDSRINLAVPADSACARRINGGKLQTIVVRLINVFILPA